MFGDGGDKGWRLESDATRVTSRGANREGPVCHAKKQESMVELRKGYKLERKIIKSGKVTKSPREGF